MPFHFETPRLIIRNFRDSDLEPLLACRNDPEVAIYQGWKLPYPRESGLELIANTKDKEAVHQGEGLQLAVQLKDTAETIGDLGLFVFRHDARQARIGFTIARGHWRRGFATEASTRLLGVSF